MSIAPTLSLNSSSTTPETIHIRFIESKNFNSSDIKPRIPLTQFSVPLSSTPETLNQLVNDLLQDFEQNQEQKIKYQNFVSIEDGSLFYEGTLADYIENRKFSSENVIEFDFFERLCFLKNTNIFENHTDQISSIDFNATNLISATYDGVIKLCVDSQNFLDGKQSKWVKLNTGQNAVKDIKFFGNGGIGSNSIFVCSKIDGTVSIYKHFNGEISEKNESEFKKLASCFEHTSSVDCIAINPELKNNFIGEIGNSQNQFITGSSDKTIRLQKYENIIDDENALKKRRKIKESCKNENSIKHLSSIVTLTSHKNTVSSLCWPDSHALYSGSQDHTIRFQDLERAVEVAEQKSIQPINALDFSIEHNLCLAAHPDSSITLWDFRIGSTVDNKLANAANIPIHKRSISKFRLTKHNQCSKVCWAPEPHIFASADYGGNIYCQDIRQNTVSTVNTICEKPFNDIKAQNNKILCLGWYKKEENSFLISGGADNKLAVSKI